MTSASTNNPLPSQQNARDAGAVRHLWLSPWTTWVGFRYLKSKKNSRFLSFITVLSILGVGVGVTAMIVVLSVMDGFQNELKKRLMSSELHVLITPTPAVPGFEMGFVPNGSFSTPEVERYIKSNSDIATYWPIISTEAIFKVGRKVNGIVFKGVTEERLEHLKAQLVEIKPPGDGTEAKVEPVSKLPGIYIGQELANEMGVVSGDQATLISPTETEGPMDSVPRLKRYQVIGVYHSGLPEQELHTVFAPESAVRSFLKRNDVVSQWEISVKDFDRAPSVAAGLRALAPQFKVQDWIQLNSHLFASLRLERISMFVILAFIVVVASFNIVTTLTLLVLEKKREISIMKAMGARNGQVAAVFLAEGLLIGGVGIGGGVSLGFVLCVLLKRYEFITLPDIYYDRTLPVTFDPMYYVIVGLCAALIVLTACLYPSHRAARLHPLEGIRFG
jgi:lipoprotein-releasing system permease protein